MLWILLAGLAWCWLLGAAVLGLACWLHVEPADRRHLPTFAAVAALVLLWPLSLPLLVLFALITAWRFLR